MHAGGVLVGGRAAAVAARRRGAAQVLERRARHPEQEQVEHGDEAELQGDGDGVEGHASLSSWKTISEVPRVIVSPSRSDCAPVMRRPLTLTPLVEPRSRTVHEAPEGRTSACLRETLGSSTARRPRASGRARRRRSRARSCGRRRAGARRGGADRARAAARTMRLGGRVDHRVAVVALARARRSRPPRRCARAAPGCRTRPSRSALVGLELDLRARQQRDPLAAGVLEQVAGQLALELALVALELLAILAARARRRTRSARRCATARRPCAAPSRARACARSRPGGPRT